MKATAELKMLPVSVLKPAAYNPRKKLKPGDKEYEKIKNSITEFGFADPLVVNADMTIIGGHQRLTVAMELGYTEVPCAVVDIDKTREKALNIALNKITGAWDDSLLADLLKDIEDSNFDLGKTGFEPPEIETLFNKVHSKEVKEDDFDVESELKQPCFSKEGDLWHLGKHRVLCGDSTKAESYDTLMDGTKANIVLVVMELHADFIAALTPAVPVFTVWLMAAQLLLYACSTPLMELVMEVDSVVDRFSAAAVTRLVLVVMPFASPCMKSGIQLSISANGPSSGTEKCRKERIRSATPDTALATS